MKKEGNWFERNAYIAKWFTLVSLVLVIILIFLGLVELAQFPNQKPKVIEIFNQQPTHNPPTVTYELRNKEGQEINTRYTIEIYPVHKGQGATYELSISKFNSSGTTKLINPIDFGVGENGQWDDVTANIDVSCKLNNVREVD